MKGEYFKLCWEKMHRMMMADSELWSEIFTMTYKV
jgi:hypothetical protein